MNVGDSCHWLFIRICLSVSFSASVSFSVFFQCLSVSFSVFLCLSVSLCVFKCLLCYFYYKNWENLVGVSIRDIFLREISLLSFLLIFVNIFRIFVWQTGCNQPDQPYSYQQRNDRKWQKFWWNGEIFAD